MLDKQNIRGAERILRVLDAACNMRYLKGASEHKKILIPN